MRKSKMTIEKFDNDSLRLFWDKQAQDLHPTYFVSKNTTDKHLHRTFTSVTKHFDLDLRGKSLLKLDLWNEATHTNMLEEFHRQGAEVSGIDISGEVVKKAHQNFMRKKIPHDFRQADMRNLPFPDNTFDVVYSMGTAEHVRNTQKVIEENYRVLKPGGKIIIGVPNRYNLWLRAQVVWLMQKLDRYPYGFAQSFSLWTLRRMAHRAGLADIRMTGIIYYPWPFRYLDIHPKSRQSKILSKLIPIVVKPFFHLEYKFPMISEYIVAYGTKPKM